MTTQYSKKRLPDPTFIKDPDVRKWAQELIKTIDIQFQDIEKILIEVRQEIDGGGP